MSERLQKVLSRAGYGSRRELERWIEQGRVKLNGTVATVGQQVELGDKVEVDGFRMVAITHDHSRRKVLIYNKPEGEVCTNNDPEQRPTVFDNLPKLQNSRWVMIGRLDVNTQGLLVFTTDGELAHKMMHPSSELEREYAVRLRGELSLDVVQRLLAGVELDDGPAKFESIDVVGGEGSNTWVHVVLREGRNREVRRLWESQDCQVSRLMRVRYGILTLPKGLRRGRSQFLEENEIYTLMQSVGWSTAGQIALVDEKRAKSVPQTLRGRGRSAGNASAKKSQVSTHRTERATDSRVKKTAESDAWSSNRAEAKKARGQSKAPPRQRSAKHEATPTSRHKPNKR